MKKLADTFFTLGLEFKSEEELLACAEKFCEMTVEAKAWVWTPKPKDGEEQQPLQMHLIKGVAGKEGTKADTEVPF